MRTVRGKEKTCYYPYHPSTQEDSEEHLTPKRFHSRAASKEDLSPSRYQSYSHYYIIFILYVLYFQIYMNMKIIY